MVLVLVWQDFFGESESTETIIVLFPDVSYLLISFDISLIMTLVSFILRSQVRIVELMPGISILSLLAFALILCGFVND